MPTCSRCKFYQPKDAKIGECTNVGVVILPDNDTSSPQRAQRAQRPQISHE
ncbi:MAG TPA: hypothetical protein VGJ92_14155 [Methanocella sp.]|jgi:hypothetical protein